MRIKQNKGFTLFELLIVIILIGIVTVTASRLLSTGLLGYLNGKNLTTADWQGLLGLERMSRDLLAVRSPSDITAATASLITFVDTNGATVTYALSGSTLMRNSQILADGVSSLAFAYYDRNGTVTATLSSIRYIKITLNITQSGANFSLSTSVYPRNLY